MLQRPRGDDAGIRGAYEFSAINGEGARLGYDHVQRRIHVSRYWKRYWRGHRFELGKRSVDGLNASKTWHVTTLPGATVDLGGIAATQVVTTGSAACALLQGGSVRCWGSNANGQIGVGNTGTASNYLVAAAAVDFSGHAAKRLSKSGNFCAILDDDSLRCWGFNIFGQTGNPNAIAQYAAPDAAAPDFGAGRTVLDVAGDGSATCVLIDDGSLRCFGNLGVNSWWSQYSESFTVADMLLASIDPGTTAAPSQVAMSGANYCVVVSTDGSLRCAGSYVSGQQGQGLPTFRLLPPATAMLELGP